MVGKCLLMVQALAAIERVARVLEDALGHGFPRLTLVWGRVAAAT
jgi:hypothetical protein